MVRGNDPTVHFIRDGKFVCTAEPTADCRNYPSCACEVWDDEHFDPTEPGDHNNVPQDECWLDPWLTSYPLCDTNSEGIDEDDCDYPDGPILVEFDVDLVLWRYADEKAGA